MCEAIHRASLIMSSPEAVKACYNSCNFLSYRNFVACTHFRAQIMMSDSAIVKDVCVCLSVHLFVRHIGEPCLTVHYAEVYFYDSVQPSVS